jgi:hypothetical protein
LTLRKMCRVYSDVVKNVTVTELAKYLITMPTQGNVDSFLQ